MKKGQVSCGGCNVGEATEVRRARPGDVRGKGRSATWSVEGKGVGSGTDEAPQVQKAFRAGLLTSLQHNPSLLSS